MDVDNILKYMAVHTFVVNDDSLSGTMAHNYYLYEYNGKLNILHGITIFLLEECPWVVEWESVFWCHICDKRCY